MTKHPQACAGHTVDPITVWSRAPLTLRNCPSTIIADVLTILGFTTPILSCKRMRSMVWRLSAASLP